MSKNLRIILVEDSADATELFVAAAAKVDEIELVATTDSALDGEKLIMELKPEVVVLDMELAAGSGLELSEKISRLPETERPYVVVTTVISSPVVHGVLHSHGVGYIFNKSREDYSVDMVIQHILLVSDYIGGYSPKSCCRIKDTCCKSVNASEPKAIECIKANETEMRERIGSLLEQYGITGNLLGYNYLIDMIIILSKQRYVPDLVTEVYPLIGEKYGTRSENIERNIRNSIEKAWRITPVETLNRLYPCTLNSEKGKPTVKEFCCFIAKQFK